LKKVAHFWPRYFGNRLPHFLLPSFGNTPRDQRIEIRNGSTTTSACSLLLVSLSFCSFSCLVCPRQWLREDSCNGISITIYFFHSTTTPLFAPTMSTFHHCSFKLFVFVFLLLFLFFLFLLCYIHIIHGTT
jgi:hypothetical protein